MKDEWPVPGEGPPRLTSLLNELQAHEHYSDPNAAGAPPDPFPSRDEVLEVIENICGEDLSGSLASRLADAIMRLLPARRGYSQR